MIVLARLALATQRQLYLATLAAARLAGVAERDLVDDVCTLAFAAGDVLGTAPP